MLLRAGHMVANSRKLYMKSGIKFGNKLPGAVRLHHGMLCHRVFTSNSLCRIKRMKTKPPMGT